MCPPIRAAVRLLCLTACVTLAAAAAEAAVYTVNSIDDTDDLGTCAPGDTHCTLREALRTAGLDGVASDIVFAIPPSLCPGGVCTIQLIANEPVIIGDNTRILGFTQDPGAALGYVSSNLDTRPGVNDAGNSCGAAPLRFRRPPIALNANLLPTASNPLSIGGDASHVLIQGIAVYNAGSFGSSVFSPLGDETPLDFSHAIVGLPGAGVDRLVDQTFIGVLPSGDNPSSISPACGLLDEGILEGVPGVTLDQVVTACNATEVGNVEFGVRQLSPGNLDVNKSYIGFNGKGGIDGESSGTVVRATFNEVFENGKLSFSHDGVDLNGLNSVAECNVIYENTEFLPVPKGDGGNGIEVGSSSQNPDGIYNHLVRYNTSYFNLSGGISIRKGARGNLYEKNVIYSNHVGIAVDLEGRVPTNRHEFSKNSTFRNMTQGIDLQAVSSALPWTSVTLDHVTPNDHCDVDGVAPDGSGGNTVSNDLQNWPAISSATNFGLYTRVQGTLDSWPGRTYVIEFFKTPAGDAVGPEGRTFVGSVTVTTAAAPLCNSAFTKDLPPIPAGYELTATATLLEDPLDPGYEASEYFSTSEYSPIVTVDNFKPDGKCTGGGYTEPKTATCNSPYCKDSGSSDRTNFGFNASYHNTDPVPFGHTNFVYSPGDLHMGSLDYTFASLVVNRNPLTGNGDARWRGNAKVNNKRGFCFEVFVRDNGEPGVADTFRIKIWSDPAAANSADACAADGGPVIYDSNSDVILGGGNIQIHKP